MAYDGIQYNNRVDTTTDRKLNAKVVDNILNSRTYGARLLGMSKEMTGKTFDYPIKVIDSQSGQFFTGLESFNSSASDTLAVLSYGHTAFEQAAVSIMTEAFANSGAEQVIDLQKYKLEEAQAEAIQKWAAAIYGGGQAGQPNGLGNIVDDGSLFATIGGLNRATLPVTKAQVQAAPNGLISLSTLGVLEDACTGAGTVSEEPNINLTNKTIWSLAETLIMPQMREDYQSAGYNQIALRGTDIVKPADLKGAIGLRVIAYRGKPVIKDDACPATYFMLNERYFEARGRTQVPSSYAGRLEKISLGTATTIDGIAGSPEYRPPSSNGWFYQPYTMLPQQAGMVARYYWLGQICASQLRRQGKLTGVTGV